MSNCQHCAAKCQLFLCGRCANDLRDMLRGLAVGTATNYITGETRPMAGWLELLEDAALGRTRLGESARRSTEMQSPMPCNLGASQLLQNVHGMLARIVQDICESRGMEIPG